MKQYANITFSDYDKLWISAVYEKIKQNIRPTFRLIRTELREQLPKNYHPRDIDEKLASWKGTELTLVAVDLIDPDANIISKANMILGAIRDKVTSDPEIKIIEASEIAHRLKLAEQEVRFILTLIRPYGTFWSNASSTNEHYGYSSIGVDDPNDKVFEEYLFFTDIESLIERHHAERKEESDTPGFIPEWKRPGTTQFPAKGGIYVNPIFNSRIAQKNKSICFVLMPFTQSWSNDVYNNIKTLVESLGYQCLRADNLIGRVIIEDIWVQINQAAFIIADVTGTNPNVMYELGIADTVGTPVILLTQDIEKIPFDFKHFRHVTYQNSLNGWKSAEQQISNSIQGFKHGR